MHKAADILERDREIYAEMMTLEMGKTFKSAIAEIEKYALVCHYADTRKQTHLNTVRLRKERSKN